MSNDLASWILLFTVVGAMLALDLLVVHRRARPIAFREAAGWSVVWVSLALVFGVFVSLMRGSETGGEYLAGYLIELSLSMDNVFVFALIFAAFAVPAAYQHRLLFWGILGAIVFRALFIGVGTAILAAAHWVIYLLGILLIITGIRLAASRGHAVEPEKNPVLRLFRRIVPMADGYRGAAFVVREQGRRVATPLLAVLVVVETTDIMFALDSIPAVFAVTTDPFIVFSSNLFAILGLRALYFLLAGLLDRFVYLKVGLAALLVFAGGKILIKPVYDIPIAVSLVVIGAILATAIVVSLVATRARPVVGMDRGRRSAILWSAARIGLGVSLGVGATVLLCGVVVLRDAGALWLAAEIGIVATAAAALILGAFALRHLHARSATVRGWALVGSAALLLLALFFALD